MLKESGWPLVALAARGHTAKLCKPSFSRYVVLILWYQTLAELRTVECICS